MRIAVTGKNGQVAKSLIERCTAAGVEIHTLGRPQVDLLRPDSIEPALMALRPEAVINAAAYTAVDLAESEADLAYKTNVEGAAAVARSAAKLRIPIVHLSTDYVFDGSLIRSYREDDQTAPLGVYGKSKLEGERVVAEANDNHAILRTAWVYSPFGKNFVRTMLTLASTRDEISVVEDQFGSPNCALDLADGIVAVVKNLVARPNSIDCRGVFHMSSDGETNWADFARSIFSASRTVGGPFARVRPIPSSAYPTPARRPANSRLDSTHLAKVHNVCLPRWHRSLPDCIERIIASDFSKKDQE